MYRSWEMTLVTLSPLFQPISSLAVQLSYGPRLSSSTSHRLPSPLSTAGTQATVASFFLGREWSFYCWFCLRQIRGSFYIGASSAGKICPPFAIPSKTVFFCELVIYYLSWQWPCSSRVPVSELFMLHLIKRYRDTFRASVWFVL